VIEPLDVRAAALSAPMEAPTHRGTLIADFTIDELAHVLRRSSARPIVDVRVAPFDNVTQTLLGGPADDAKDFAVVWTRPEAVIPAFGRLAESHSVPLADVLAEVDAFCELIERGAAPYRFIFVPTWTMSYRHRGLGLLDARQGMLRALTAMNHRLMERLENTAKVHVLDAQRWVTPAGTAAYQPKPWYMGKLAFSTEVFEHAANDIKAAIAALTGQARKVVAVDLDDTMWGGTVGEQGWQSLRVGGHDPQGEGFADFQRGLKALVRRGVILVIVSKNEESVALEAIDSHPEMLLRRGDFASWRINWQDKAQNITDLAAELNLGLQSFVFIDNDAVQRARVREALPEVLVPEWPEDPMFYRSALHALTCFDVPALTGSDANRTELYAAERAREQSKNQVGSLEDWLKSLDMRIRVETLSPANLPRVTQLFNKTNQMNLSTRRLTQDELVAWSGAEGRRLWAVNVSDRFGDAGLTGIISFEVENDRGRIVDFILSCRVMGRKVENTMLHLAIAHARSLGLNSVEARYLPTAKNKPCLEFWKTSGFTVNGDSVFEWKTDQEYVLPSAIQLEQAV
jgi:FkbH-like protein